MRSKIFGFVVIAGPIITALIIVLLARGEK